MNEAVREVLSGHMVGGLSDPRIGFVTVTGVQTVADLSRAQVFVSVLGDESQRAEAMIGLESSRGFLQAKVGEELRMKRTPTLEFTYDDSIDRGMRVSELLGDAERTEPTT